MPLGQKTISYFSMNFETVLNKALSPSVKKKEQNKKKTPVYLNWKFPIWLVRHYLSAPGNLIPGAFPPEEWWGVEEEGTKLVDGMLSFTDGTMS